MSEEHLNDGLCEEFLRRSAAGEFPVAMNGQLAAAAEIEKLRGQIKTLKAYMWAMVAVNDGRIVVSDKLLNVGLKEASWLQAHAKDGDTWFTAMIGLPVKQPPLITMLPIVYPGEPGQS